MQAQTAESNTAIPGSTSDEINAVKRKHALRSHTDRPSEPGSETRYIVDGLIPERQLCLLVGNSGLGKSPALYQLGICAAAGVPFLGDATTESDLLYIDFENGAEESRTLESRIAEFLGLKAVPENFLRWNADDCAAKFGQHGHGVEDMIRDWSRAVSQTGRSKLVIVDPLRYWLSYVENARFADEEIQRARRVIRETGVGIFGVHHLRRVTGQDADRIPDLEVNPRGWILAMSRGAVALVNGSDVRLGLDTSAFSATIERPSLVLAGFRRVRGQLGPIYVERVISEDDGEPLGYRRLAAVELLGLREHIEAFGRFPARFTFTEAQRVFGKSDSATANLLKKCEAIKLLGREGRTYVKTAA